MPVIKTWLTPEMREEQFNELYNALWSAVEDVPELGLSQSRPQEVTFLFPSDRMKKGLGQYLIVEVGRLTPKSERTLDVRNQLARELGGVLVAFFRDIMFVEVFVDPDGFWSWTRKERNRDVE